MGSTEVSNFASVLNSCTATSFNTSIIAPVTLAVLPLPPAFHAQRVHHEGWPTWRAFKSTTAKPAAGVSQEKHM